MFPALTISLTRVIFTSKHVVHVHIVERKGNSLAGLELMHRARFNVPLLLLQACWKTQQGIGKPDLDIIRLQVSAENQSLRASVTACFPSFALFTLAGSYTTIRMLRHDDGGMCMGGWESERRVRMRRDVIITLFRQERDVKIFAPCTLFRRLLVARTQGNVHMLERLSAKFWKIVPQLYDGAGEL